MNGRMAAVEVSFSLQTRSLFVPSFFFCLCYVCGRQTSHGESLYSKGTGCFQVSGYTSIFIIFLKMQLLILLTFSFSLSFPFFFFFFSDSEIMLKNFLAKYFAILKRKDVNLQQHFVFHIKIKTVLFPTPHQNTHLVFFFLYIPTH